MNKIALTGAMRVGKDYVAELAGYNRLSLAEPIYKLAEAFYNTSNKSIIGMRSFMQTLGQYGNKTINEQYPLTVSRAIAVDYVRNNGVRLMYNFPEFKFIDWSQFGQHKKFWVNICIDRVLNMLKDNANLKIAVTNVRFDFELDTFREIGFEHWHVMCADHTREERLRSLGEKSFINKQENEDTSELLAQILDFNMPEGRVIWNDLETFRPKKKNFISVEDFINLVAR